MSYTGMFYLRELETFSGKQEDVFMKPAYVRISVAPKPSRVIMVSYAMDYWVGYQPSAEDWDKRKRFVSPYRPIDNFGYSSRMKLDSPIEDICEEIRRHFIDLVSIGRNAYSEEDAFGLLMEKNITEIHLPLDEKHKVCIKQILLVKDYTSESSEYFSEPVCLVKALRTLEDLNKNVIYKEDQCLSLDTVTDRDDLLACVQEYYSNQELMDSMRTFYPSLVM